MRYFIISWIGTRPNHSVEYGHTNYTVGGYPNYKTLCAFMAEKGIFNLTVLSIVELTEDDFKTWEA